MIKNPSEKDDIYLANVAKIGDSVENILYIENILSEEEHAILLNFVKTRDEGNDEPWLAKTVRSSEIPEEISSIKSLTRSLELNVKLNNSYTTANLYFLPIKSTPEIAVNILY